MALEVKMAREEAGEGLSSGSESVIKVLRGMLRTGYGFAKDIPEKVYLYCSIDKENNKASFDVLFDIKGKIYTPQNLDESDVDVEWDMSQERLISLHKYLGDDLFTKIIPTMKLSAKQIPAAIQASYDIETDKQITFFEYGTNHSPAKEQWKDNIESVDDGFILNMVDFDYLNIDEGF